MWLRVLDVAAALSARTYAGGAASLVLDVTDRAGLAGGRFLLETDPAGTGVCRPAPAAAAPDLSLDVADLGRLYLGDESPVRLAALGRLTENRTGAARTADVLFRTPRRPWCPDVF
jgi:predicted acetyltransferase